MSFFEERDVSLVALDEALNEPAGLNARQARAVELRFFGGLKVEEIAEVLKVTEGPCATTGAWRRLGCTAR